MDKINYFYGKNGTFADVLVSLAATKVNSIKTSSLPLAQFWKPSEKLNTFIDEFKDKSRGIDVACGDRFFEYPTDCIKNGEKLYGSRPSMTDLMIINDEYQIAIEGKYTEYSKAKYETISEWINKGKSHKIKIKERWFEYIKECGATTIDLNQLDDTIPYQFLHRTASACFNCKSNNKKPILIYQVFYDESNRIKKDKFIANLKEWAKLLGFTELIQFFIIEVKILNDKELNKIRKKNYADIFLEIENSDTIYKFDWDGINIITV